MSESMKLTLIICAAIVLVVTVCSVANLCIHRIEARAEMLRLCVEAPAKVSCQF